MTDARAGEVDVGGVRLATLTWGPVDGPLVLAVHGYPDSAWTWRRLAPILADAGYRVVAPFTRGYAPSSLAPDGRYQVGALVRDLERLATRLDGGAPVRLIGHDWGAITAYAASSHRPDLFGSLVTIAVPPMAGAVQALRRWGVRPLRIVAHQARCSWYIGYQQLPWLPERTFDRVVERLWRDWSPGYDPTEDLAHLRAALPSGPHRSAALQYYRALAQPWRRSREYLAEQRHLDGIPPHPVLYLHGERDGCLVPDLAVGASSVLAEGSRVEFIADAGHFVQLEQPFRTAELVLSHLDQQEH